MRWNHLMFPDITVLRIQIITILYTYILYTYKYMYLYTFINILYRVYANQIEMLNFIKIKKNPDNCHINYLDNYHCLIIIYYLK